MTRDPWWWLAKTYRVFNKHEYILLQCTVSRDSSVGKATPYGLDGPGIESRWRRYFPHPSTQALWSIQPPVQWVPGPFPGVKRPERGVDCPPPPTTSQCRGQKKSTAVTLFHLWTPILCSRVNFTFLLLYYVLYRVITCHKIVYCLLYSTVSTVSNGRTALYK